MSLEKIAAAGISETDIGTARDTATTAGIYAYAQEKGLNKEAQDRFVQAVTDALYDLSTEA